MFGSILSSLNSEAGDCLARIVGIVVIRTTIIAANTTEVAIVCGYIDVVDGVVDDVVGVRIVVCLL